MHAIFFIHKTVKKEVKINVIDRMNFYAIFKINLIGNLSYLHKELSSVVAQMNCGPHSNPTPANGHQISLSAYKEAKEDTATELKKR